MRHRRFGSNDTALRPAQKDCAPLPSGASRREFLKSLAVVGAGAILPASGLIAQVTSPAARASTGPD